MTHTPAVWDYLIVTAANEQKAAAYDLQIQARRRAGGLADVRELLVVPDSEGRRVGSGGSTLQCLVEVLRREGAIQEDSGTPITETILSRLRILIVHAGGDSRRLPAYSPCGKIFVPLPGPTPPESSLSLFDRLVPAFLALPENRHRAGQIVVASGDALLLFDSAEIDLSRPGINALGVRVSPDEAARHGVLCPNTDGTVRCYLQKPQVAEQAKAGAIDIQGQSVLDIGVMSMDATAAACLLRAFGTDSARSAIASHGIDLYREICCALGTEATLEHYRASARSSGSKVEEAVLGDLFDQLRSTPFNVQVVDRCAFLHFGTTRQLITSGRELATHDWGAPPPNGILVLDSELGNGARIAGADCWVEGCRLQAPLTLHRWSVAVGIDVSEPLELPEGACLDTTPGFDRQGEAAWFIRCYGIEDTFKDSVGSGATFCGRKLTDWLQQVGAAYVQIWDTDTPEAERTLWNARVFPAEKENRAFLDWRWMFDIDSATPEQKKKFLEADRYSSAEIALWVDHRGFQRRRAEIRHCNESATQAALGVFDGVPRR